jgi:RNA polymerase sigma factor (sigma-70 family)
VQSLAYRIDLNFAPFFINETAAGLEERSPLPRPKLDDWSDQEIVSIRNALHRLTALRVANAEDAEDLVQDTFLTMAMKYPEIKLEKGLLIWSMGILRKKVGNYYRKAQRNTAVNDERGSALESAQSDPSATSPEIKLRQEELSILIYRVLATLPESHRQALELLLAGMRANEIVELLSPERYQNTINWLHRGRRKLARELARYGYGPKAKSEDRRPWRNRSGF